MAASEKKQLRFRAGEVGFVFYEDSVFPGTTPGATYAFSTIAGAAAWLLERFSDATPATEASRSAIEGSRFMEAERALLGQRWTFDQAERLRLLVSMGASGPGKDT